MADAVNAFNELVRWIQTREPGARGLLKSEWRAPEAGARLKIRESILETLSDWRHDEKVSVTDLKYPPRPHAYSISISHAPEWGGWLAVPRPVQIGFDIEKKSRIENRIVERVSSAEDVKAAPEASYLWPAKEAYFKALEDEQPETVGQLSIRGWSRENGGLWRWRGIGPRNGEGALIETGDWLLAACFVN